MAENKGKNPLYSKTLWINVLAIIGSGVMYFSGMDTETWATISTSALALINVALRMVTNEPINME
jgi:hypothetical protein